MKKNTLPFGVLLLLFQGSIGGSDAGEVFARVSDATKTTSTPKSVSLLSAQGSEAAVRVKAALAQVRLAHERSRGAAGFTATESEFRKFVRFEILCQSRAVRPASIEATYQVEEEGLIEDYSETVAIPAPTPAFVVDLEGFTDVAGASVTDTFGVNTVTSIKTKSPVAEIVGVRLLVKDAQGGLLYAGAWPDPAEELVKLPDTLKPRVLTNIHGQKIEALILGVNGETVTIESRGKVFDLALPTLSEADRTYLAGFADRAAAAVPPMPVAGVDPVGGGRSTRPVAAGGEGPFEERAPAGALLVGLRYWVAELEQIPIPVIRAVQPVYEGPEGRSEGAIHGSPVGSRGESLAEPGSAVGAMELSTGLALDRFKLTFFRKGSGDAPFDPRFKTEGEWCGGRGGDRISVLGGDGTRAVGIHGSANGDRIQLGLLYEDGTRARPGDRTE